MNINSHWSNVSIHLTTNRWTPSRGPMKESSILKLGKDRAPTAIRTIGATAKPTHRCAIVSLKIAFAVWLVGPTATLGQTAIRPIRIDSSWQRTAADLNPATSAPRGGSIPVTVGAVNGFEGRTYSITGNVYTIPQVDGKVSGASLFHSFERFNIPSGDAAVFQTQIGNGNVISRVSGDAPTSVNGLLAVNPTDGGKPNFFFINPNGVTFGAGAQVDVPASFQVSTANELRFKNDLTVFKAGQGPDSTFTSAKPESFGFLGGAAAKVAINNLDPTAGRPAPGMLALVLSSGQTLEVTAGAIEIDTSDVSAPNGQIKLVAIGGGPVAISGGGTSAPAIARLGGTITMRNSTVSTDERGHIDLQAGSIELDNAEILARSSVLGPGSISLLARDKISLGNSTVSSFALGTTSGPSIVIESGGSIDLSDTTGKGLGFVSSTLSEARAGDISVAGKSVAMSGNASIASQSLGLGRTGDISTNVAQHLLLSDSAAIFSEATATEAPTSLVPAGSVHITAGSLTIDALGSGTSRISSDSKFSAASAGDVSVVVTGPLVIRGGGSISSSAFAHPDFPPFATQKSGTVSVRADSITIEGLTAEDGNRTGIFSDGLGFTQDLLPGRLAPGPGGSGGQVFVEARNIAIRGEGGISADTSGPGTGGAVTVKADKVLLDGGGIGGTYISSFTSGQGSGGTVRVVATDSLSLVNGGIIDASTVSSGNAGNVLVEAKNLSVDGAATLAVTGIRAVSAGSGNAGNITVSRSENVGLVRGGVISASTVASGNAGSVNVMTRNLLIDGQADPLTGVRSLALPTSSGHVGQIAVFAEGIVTLLNGGALTIKNDAAASDLQDFVAKSIRVDAASVLMDGGNIVASSTGNAPASAIHIGATDHVTMQNSASILTTAQDGNGGPIDVAAGRYISMSNSQIATSVLGTSNGNGGDIGIAAPALALKTGFIQANTAAPRATGGDIKLNLGALISSGNSLFVAEPEVVPFQSGVFGSNVIQAAAPEGVSGNIRITSPQLDLTGSLTNLSAAIMDTSSLSRDLCRVGAGSSLTPIGRGGLAPSALDALRPESTSTPACREFWTSAPSTGTPPVALSLVPIPRKCFF